jgi:carbamoyl-phosphate synthase large subunit
LHGVRDWIAGNLTFMNGPLQKKVNVFISGGGGDVADATLDCLNLSSLNLNIAIASSKKSALLTYDVNRLILLPEVNSTNYLSALIKALKLLEIDIFFPTVAGEMSLIAVHAREIELQTGAKVFVGQDVMVETFSDKYATTEFLRQNNFAYPDTCLFDSSANESSLLKRSQYPLIAKPRFGNGSKGFLIIRDENDLSQIDRSKDYVLQEMLPISDGEFTAGVYVAKRKTAVGVCILKRLLNNGSTVIAERILDSRVETQLENIAICTELPYVNIQFALRENVVIPFEINPRFSGTTFMQVKALNAPEMAIKEQVLNLELEVIKNDHVYRAKRKKVVEFDDGLLEKNEILLWQ